jgi:hypothetical protein
MHKIFRLFWALLIISCLTWSADAQTPPATQPAGETVTVDAYWLRLKPSQLAPGQAVVPANLLSDAGALYAHARIVGPQGQEVTVDVTRTLSVVTGETPIVAPGVAIYQPTLSDEPVAVKLTETATRIDGDFLQVSFDSSVSMVQEGPVGEPATRPTTDPINPPPPLVIDAHGKANTSTAVLHAKSTVRIQNGVPTIVTGMSDKPGEPDNRTLCLVICANIGPAK